MEIIGIIALGVAISSGLFIYNHFTTLFEAQMEVTNKILQNCLQSTIASAKNGSLRILVRLLLRNFLYHGSQ